jgi:hypothetical protein
MPERNSDFCFFERINGGSWESIGIKQDIGSRFNFFFNRKK